MIAVFIGCVSQVISSFYRQIKESGNFNLTEVPALVGPPGLEPGTN